MTVLITEPGTCEILNKGIIIIVPMKYVKPYIFKPIINLKQLKFIKIILILIKYNIHHFTTFSIIIISSKLLYYF